MSFLRFSRLIDGTRFGKFFDRKADQYALIDPDKIYIENIRAFLGITTRLAKLLAEMAVRQKQFRKKYEVKCPGCGRAIMSIENPIDVPQTIHCKVCEELEKENCDFEGAELKPEPFYQLISR